MPREQIIIGALVAALCLAGLWQSGWFVANTKKGRWLAERFGETRALWTLRILFGLGALFGVLLATNVVRPVQW
jgi:hypothetical protein